MLNRFYYGCTPRDDSSYMALLDRLSGSKPNSEYTSSLPLVQIWKPDSKGYERLKRWFAQDQELNGFRVDEAEKVFEHATPILDGFGTGKPSMTDLMLEHENASYKIAIEAKFKEVFERYETIGKWFDKGLTKKNLAQDVKARIHENRLRVLSGWLRDVVGDNDLVKSDVSVDPILRIDPKLLKVPYQFLHRAAAACRNMNGKCKPIVIYMIFWNRKVDNSKTTKKADGQNRRKCFIDRLWDAYEVLQGCGAAFTLKICEIETMLLEDQVPSKSELGELYSKMKGNKEIYQFEKITTVQRTC